MHPTRQSEAAVVRNEHGGGHVEYVGLWPGPDLAAAVSTALLDRADVLSGDRLPEMVRLTERGGHTWVTNFRADEITVDAGDGAVVLGDETVPGRDLAVVAGPAHGISVNLGR